MASSINNTINGLIEGYCNKKGYHKNYVSFVCRVLIVVILLILFLVPTFYINGLKILTLGLSITCILLTCTIFLLKSKLNISIIVNIFLLIYSLGITNGIIEYGRMYSPFIPLLICTPFIAAIILKRIELVIWIIITTVTLSLMSTYSVKDSEIASFVNNTKINYLIYIITDLVIICTVLCISYFHWKYMQKEDDKEVEKDVIYLDDSDINYFILNWNFIKSKLYDKFPNILEKIDKLHFLTDHEKKYALIKHFRLDINILTEKMNVSKRTIETNLYRVKLKMKKNNIDPYILHKKN